jgi:hypothetical protein
MLEPTFLATGFPADRSKRTTGKQKQGECPADAAGDRGRWEGCQMLSKKTELALVEPRKIIWFFLKDNLLASFVNQTQEKRDQLTAFDQTCFFWQSSIYEFQ